MTIKDQDSLKLLKMLSHTPMIIPAKTPKPITISISMKVQRLRTSRHQLL